MYTRKYDRLMKSSIIAVENALADKHASGVESVSTKESMSLAIDALRANSSLVNDDRLQSSDKLLRSLASAIVKDIYRLGPLEELLKKEDVTEIMVNGPNSVYVETHGVLTKSDTVHFFDNEHIRKFVYRIAEADGRHCDDTSPMCNCILHRPGTSFDGSRVNATVPPASPDYPTLTIRKFRNDVLTPESLIETGTIDQNIAEILKALVISRMNVAIIGGTGSGKTTMLNAVSTFIPDDQRIITIEDTAELKLQNSHIVRLQSRDASTEGKGEITIQQLFRNALRQRPDRIIVGECRGIEALDMLQAMGTGHDGSLTTLHANNAIELPTRIQAMINLDIRSGDKTQSDETIKQQISRSLDFIVTVGRFSDGSRRMKELVEVRGMEGIQTIVLEPLISFKQTGFGDRLKSENGHRRILGEFVSSGRRPSNDHIERFECMDVEVKSRWFANA